MCTFHLCKGTDQLGELCTQCRQLCKVQVYRRAASSPWRWEGRMRVTSPSSIGHRHGGPPASFGPVLCEQKVDNVCRFVLAQSCVHWPSLSLLPSHDEHWCLGRASWRWTFYGFSNESHHSGKAGHEGVGLQRRMKQWESEELISAAA